MPKPIINTVEDIQCGYVCIPEEYIKYCPLCGSTSITRVGRRLDLYESVFACRNCKDGFTATFMGQNVIKKYNEKT